MAAFLGALLGRHLAHTEDQRQIAKTVFLTKVMGKLKDATDPTISTEDANQGLQMAQEYGIVDKRTGNILKGQLAAAQKKWDAAEEGRRAQRDATSAPPAPGNQGTTLGMPQMSPATAAPVAPQPQLPPPPQFNAAGGGGLIGNTPQPGLAAPYQTPPSPDNSAILQRLLPALLAAKAQGGMQNSMLPGTTPPGMGPGAAPGIPQNGGATLPPANGGAGAGPTPPAQGQPGENPQMVLGAAKGGTGFNVMPPADMPGARIVPPAPPQYNFAPPPDAATAPAPVPAQNAPPPRPTGLFPYRNSPTLEQVAAIKGRAAAAEALPTAEQANTLALKQEAATYQQKRSQQLAEQEYMLTALRNSPDYKNAAPLQRLEMEARIRGMQGAISPVQKFLNLPKSMIKGDKWAAGSETVGGAPIDPAKWYSQQQDPNTGEVRGIEGTPTLQKTRMMTERGPVLIFTDPEGQLDHADYEIGGARIVDPRLLETIHTSLQNRTITSVGPDGRPVTAIVQVPTASKSQKVLPGRGGGTLPAPPAAEGGPTPVGSPVAPARGAPTAAPAVTPVAGGGGRVIVSYPKPLTAATQRTAEFAQSVQKHTDRIDSLIDDLEKDGKLDFVANHWNDFLTGKAGVGDPRFSALQTNLGMFSSALGVAHQTKGVQMMQHFKDMADAGKLTGPILKSNFKELKSWIDTYAALGSNRAGAIDTGGPMNNPPEGTHRKALADHFK